MQSEYFNQGVWQCSNMEDYRTVKTARDFMEWLFNENETVEQLKAENAEYKQKLADGRMVCLPCKVGDTVWLNEFIGRTECSRYKKCFNMYFCQSCDYSVVGCDSKPLFKTVSKKVKKIEIGTDMYIRFEDNCKKYEIGKTVFLKKEQAEQVLKEMEMSK